MTPKDELAASLNRVVLFFLLSFFFFLSQRLLSRHPFHKVTILNDCSGKKGVKSRSLSPVFCIATPSMPLGMTTKACFHVHNT